MKFSLIALVFATTFTTPLLANACQKTVMGGCIQEPTHDTSSHMKSQIVNKVEPVKPIDNQSASASKIGSKKSNGAGNIIQTVNKAVIK
jgi:hypothetical protein